MQKENQFQQNNIIYSFQKNLEASSCLQYVFMYL